MSVEGFGYEFAVSSGDDHEEVLIGVDFWVWNKIALVREVGRDDKLSDHGFSEGDESEVGIGEGDIFDTELFGVEAERLGVVDGDVGLKKGEEESD